MAAEGYGRDLPIPACGEKEVQAGFALGRLGRLSRRKQIVGCREAAKFMAAEGLQLLAKGAREVVTDNDRAV